VRGNDSRSDEFPAKRDLAFPATVGEQTVVANALESAWQDVQQEAAQELQRAQ